MMKNASRLKGEGGLAWGSFHLTFMPRLHPGCPAASFITSSAASTPSPRLLVTIIITVIGIVILFMIVILIVMIKIIMIGIGVSKYCYRLLNAYNRPVKRAVLAPWPYDSYIANAEWDFLSPSLLAFSGISLHLCSFLVSHSPQLMMMPYHR